MLSSSRSLTVPVSVVVVRRTKKTSNFTRACSLIVCEKCGKTPGKTNKRTCQHLVPSVVYSLIGWQKKALKKLYMRSLGLFHTTPEEFENGGFTLKMHQMFSVWTQRRKNLKTQQSPVILNFCLSKTRAGKYLTLIVFEPNFLYQNVLCSL